MSQLKNINLIKMSLVIFFTSVCFACNFFRSNQVVVSQNTNNDISQQSDEQLIIGKAYFVASNKEKIVEFRVSYNKKGEEKLSVYLDGIEKVSLNNVANPQILSDFYDNFYGRVFILAVASPASGKCGNSSFSIVTVNERNYEVKISKPSIVECQGEIQDIKIETKHFKKEVYREVTVDKLKFNIEKFEWMTNKSKK